MDPKYLVNLMVEQSVSFFITVPALGLEYYNMPAAQNLTSLRSAMFIGEPMPMELVHLINRNVPKGVRIYNTYGKWRIKAILSIFVRNNVGYLAKS